MHALRCRGGNEVCRIRAFRVENCALPATVVVRNVEGSEVCLNKRKSCNAGTRANIVVHANGYESTLTGTATTFVAA